MKSVLLVLCLVLFPACAMGPTQAEITGRAVSIMEAEGIDPETAPPHVWGAALEDAAAELHAEEGDTIMDVVNGVSKGFLGVDLTELLKLWGLVTGAKAAGTKRGRDNLKLVLAGKGDAKVRAQALSALALGTHTPKEPGEEA